MFEELKKYLSDYSKEIDEWPQQEYDKSLRDLWERNGAMAAKILSHLNVRYLSLHRIKDIPEEHWESYKDRANYMSDKMVLIGSAGYSFSNGHFSKDCPSETVAHQNFHLDALKTILSKNYSPPEETKDILDHLLTLHFFYAYLLPTTPGLSHIIPARAGYALARLTASALRESSKVDKKGWASKMTKTKAETTNERREKVYSHYSEGKKQSGDIWERHSINQQATFILDDFKEEGCPEDDLPGHSTIRDDISAGKKAGLI